MDCLVCKSKNAKKYNKVDGVTYFECDICACIFADQNTIINKHQDYSLDYWKTEISSSRERSYGISLALCAEVFILSSVRIETFLDIGTGPGYFLDAVSILMPNYKELFYGVEKFPPQLNFVSNHQNYITGDLSKINLINKKISGGICVEVIEHLYPNDLENLAENLAKISQDGALYIFNSGQPDYVKYEDFKYLDPYIRGHVVSYSIKSLEYIFNKYGFKITSIPGRTWAFIAEYNPMRTLEATADAFSKLVWLGLDENIKKLQDNGFGPLMHILGVNSLRASVESQVVKERTLWALSLNEELERLQCS